MDTIQVMVSGLKPSSGESAARTSIGRNLLSALTAGEYDTAEMILEQGPDLTVVDDDGNSALHLALTATQQGGSPTDLIRRLLQAGASPHKKNNKRETPLFHLGHSGYFLDFAPLLIDAGVDINSRDDNGKTLLFRERWFTWSLEEYMKLGLRADVRDYRGRTILHEIFRSRFYIAPGLIPQLITLGVDPGAVDQDGNTVIHDAVLGGSFQGLLETIVGLGLDFDQANYEGRTPLHNLCSLGTHEPEEYADFHDLLRSVTAMSQKIDASDQHGIRPIHLASTVSEMLVDELLRRGADPTVATSDGLTPLHLAARARQGNIVGMLIERLEMIGSSVLNAVNVKDRRGWTALAYACRSGRPELVALLLEAGADPTLGAEDRTTAFDMCSDFAEEQILWTNYRRQIRRRGDDRYRCCGPVFHLCAEGLRIGDKSRPFCTMGKELKDEIGDYKLDEISTSHTARLDEILDMLTESTQKHGKDSAWISCTLRRILQGVETRLEENPENHLDLYIQRTLRLRLARDNALNVVANTPNNGSDSTFNKSLAKSIGCASSKILQEVEIKEGSYEQHLVQRLLKRRDYELVEELARRGANLRRPSDEQGSDMNLLATHGFAKILESVDATMKKLEGTIESVTRETGQPDTSEYMDRTPLAPLLVSACESELPNMGMVRMLVEKLRVDLNARTPKTLEDCDDIDPLIGYRAAIHIVARGTHWWQVSQAIPYLAQAGASLDVRNQDGETALLVAIGSSSLFRKCAALKLIELGADPNAVDGRGRSCLARANDRQLAEMLLAKGARLEPTVLFGVLDSHSEGALETLLEAGADPSATMESYEKIEEDRERWWSKGQFPTHVDMDREQWSPLHYAASPESPAWKSVYKPDRKKMARLSSLLLAYGADPYAEFSQPCRPIKSDDIMPPVLLDGIEAEVPRKIETALLEATEKVGNLDTLERSCFGSHGARLFRWRRKRRSLIHALLEDGGYVQSILELPSLELEHRDAEGRTLLHSACRNALGSDASIDCMIVDSPHATRLVGPSKDPFRDRSRTRIVQHLFDRGADPLAIDNAGKNVLHHLLEANDQITTNGGAPVIGETLRSILARFPSIVNHADAAGTFPLHSAVRRMIFHTSKRHYRGDVETAVDDLLDAGADFMSRDGRGNSVLHYLAINLAEQERSKLQRNLFRRLLDLGADINAKNDAGYTPLFALLDDDGQQAKVRGMPKFLTKPVGAYEEYALERMEQRISSLSTSDEEVFGLFDAAGARWDAKDHAGRTLLHVVAAWKHEKALSRFNFLVEKGLDRTLKDAQDRTALDVAAANNNEYILEMFRG